MRIEIDPMGKPRMTRSDKWKQRECVARYWEFKDKMRSAWGDRPVPDRLDLIFTIPMPKSWSKKKRAAMIGQPHRDKPDIDNLAKAVLDSLLENDSYVWEMWAIKRWGEKGSIDILEGRDIG